MKTTIELPDKLLQEAKAVAVSRKTTLKAIIERALKREIQGAQTVKSPHIEVDAEGMPLLKKSNKKTVTNEQVYDIMEDLDI